MNDLLNIVRESLIAISHPRYYKTERGFQGEFLAELKQRLPSLQWEGAIVEQEYQKRMPDHGIRIRPDIIVHVPFESGRTISRSEGNFVVFELKLNADAKDALQDYENLSSMCEVLGYPLGVFINISATSAHLNQYHGPHKEKLHAFAVRLHGNQVEVQDEYATEYQGQTTVFIVRR